MEDYGAKEIRRADLHIEDDISQRSSRSSSPDTATASKLQAKLAALYGDVVEQPHLESTASNKIPESHVEKPTQAKDEASYAFKLFSSVPPATAAGTGASAEGASDVQRVIISSLSTEADSATAGGGFLSSHHPGYYMTALSSKWNVARTAKFTDPSVAVPGSWVTEQSRLRNRGLELSWRLRTIKVSKKQINLLQGVTPGNTISVFDSEIRGKKAKPNKKRRIILRERKRKQEADKLQKQRRLEDKEREEREKRTRRNREKKVKKKEKMKAKKLQAEPAAEEA